MTAPSPTTDRRRDRGARHRGFLRTAAAILAVVAVVAAASEATDDGRPADPPTRTAAETPRGLTTPLFAPSSLLEVRELGFRVEPVEGAEVSGWSLEAERQAVFVTFDDDPRRLEVAVYYRGAVVSPPSTGHTEAVSIHGARGTYTESIAPDRWTAGVVWEYAPDAWAEVSAQGDILPPADLRTRILSVAEALRSGGEPVRIPVRVEAWPRSLPAIAQAHEVSAGGGDGTWMLWLSTGELHLWATSDAAADCVGSDGTPYTAHFTYRGHPGCRKDGRLGLQRDEANVFLDFPDLRPTGDGLPIADMKELLAELTIARENPSTWFDLEAALG